MDEFANSTIIHATDHTGHLAGMASEEMDDVYTIPARHPSGDYLLVFDPVDGSSNIDVNVSIGTIFSIYRYKRLGRRRRPTERDFLRRGTDQVCAGLHHLRFEHDAGVHDRAGNPRIHPRPAPRRVPALPPEHPHPLSRQDLQRQRGKRRQVVSRSPQLRQQPQNERQAQGPPYSARYIGSLVSDFHRNLLKGGIFLYPATANRKAASCGCCTRRRRWLMSSSRPEDAPRPEPRAYSISWPENLHQRTPLIIGSADDVAEAESCMQS